jgi:hypothetical protein
MRGAAIPGCSRLSAGLCAVALALPLSAHVGSPDVFHEGAAGPYRLLVTIRPPQIIPGVAEVEIRTLSPGVREIHIVPMPIRQNGLAPVPDIAHPLKDDPQYYTGSLWLMSTGSWKVRVEVDGAQGRGTLAVPVPALSKRLLPMQSTLAAILIPLGLVLILGMIAIAGASVREGPLDPGVAPDAARSRRARIAMMVTAVLLIALVWGGNSWWTSEAAFYGRIVFKPLSLNATVTGHQLALKLVDPGWLNRRTDDLALDHGHLMHLYVIRSPEMDRVWHLHPERSGDGFTQALPDIPAGRYNLYADVVHANGIGETATATLDIPDIRGEPLTGDDAAGTAPPVNDADYNRNVTTLSDGYQLVFDRPAAVHARQPNQFRFHLQDPHGQPARGMELYMGMLGHAAFVATDGSVFAHVHPSGSVPMPALSLAEAAGQSVDPHAAHRAAAAQSEIPAEVSFPYGFPKPGAYRVFVQMKRAGQIATGAYSVRVEN